MRRSIARSSLKMCETEYAPDIGRNRWNPRRHADHIIHGRNLPALQRELKCDERLHSPGLLLFLFWSAAKTSATGPFRAKSLSSPTGVA